jgi:hypothetical protein
MGKTYDQQHRCVEVNIEKLTMICSQCGPVDAKPHKTNNDKLIYQCGNVRRALSADYVNRRNNDQELLERHREYNREYSLHSSVRSSHGLTTGQARAMVNKIGKCEICGATVRMAVDHDHETKLLRGVLCHNHNIAIGMMGDTLEGVLKVVAYLQRPPAQYDRYDDYHNIQERST